MKKMHHHLVNKVESQSVKEMVNHLGCQKENHSVKNFGCNLVM